MTSAASWTSSSPSGSRMASSSPPRRAIDGRSPRLPRRASASDDDQLVAGAVAERVVDVLEVVEVEHQRRAGGAVAADVLDVALQRARERAAIEQAGQRVVVGQVAQLGLVAAPLGDVLDLEQDVLRLAGGVAHQRRVDRGPEDLAGGVQPAPLSADRAAVAAAEAGERLGLVRAVVGVQQPHDRRALELVLLAAGERAQRAVDLQEAPVDRGDRHADRRLLEGGAEAGLGVGLGALGLGAGVDVADRGVDLGERAAVADRQQLGVGPAPGAVGAAQADGDRHGVSSSQRDAAWRPRWSSSRPGGRGRPRACRRALRARGRAARGSSRRPRGRRRRGRWWPARRRSGRRARASGRRPRGGRTRPGRARRAASAARGSRCARRRSPARSTPRPRTTSQAASGVGAPASGPIPSSSNSPASAVRSAEERSGTAVARGHPPLSASSPIASNVAQFGRRLLGRDDAQVDARRRARGRPDA